MKKLWSKLGLCTLALTFAACVIDIPLTVVRGGWGPDDAPYHTEGEYIYAMGVGFEGIPLRVYIKLEEGYITSFRFLGGFSDGFARDIAARAPAWERTILETNNFDFPVVGSGATPTLRGIRTAGRNALIDNFPSITEGDFTIND